MRTAKALIAGAGRLKIDEETPQRPERGDARHGRSICRVEGPNGPSLGSGGSGRRHDMMNHRGRHGHDSPARVLERPAGGVGTVRNDRGLAPNIDYNICYAGGGQAVPPGWIDSVEWLWGHFPSGCVPDSVSGESR